MFPPKSADQGTVLSICYSSYGTSIDNVYVAMILSLFMAQSHELLFHGLGLILVDLATQCVTLKLHNSLQKTL